MITIHQRHRRTDGRTTCDPNKTAHMHLSALLGKNLAPQLPNFMKRLAVFEKLHRVKPTNQQTRVIKKPPDTDRSSLIMTSGSET